MDFSGSMGYNGPMIQRGDSAPMEQALLEAYPRIPESDPVLRCWCRHLGHHSLSGKTLQNFYSLFSYLEQVIANGDG